MALAKSIAFKGTTLNYHKIGTINIDLMAGKTTVGLLSYVDQATCDADPSAFLNGQYVSVEGTPTAEASVGLANQAEQLQAKPLGLDDQVSPDPIPADPIAWAYDQIQLLPDWTDATNA